MLQFVSVITLYSNHTNLSDSQFLFADLFLVMPLSFALSILEPASTLSKETPQTQLFCADVIVPVFAQVAFQFLIQCYVQMLPDVGSSRVTIRNTSFLICCYQYIAVCLAFGLGNTNFRKSIFKTPKFIAIIGFAMLCCFYITLWPNGYLGSVLGLSGNDSSAELPLGVRFWIAVVGTMISIPASWVVEHHAADVLRLIQKKIKRNKQTDKTQKIL